MRDVYAICLIIGFLLLMLSVAGELLESFTGSLEALLNTEWDFDLDFLPLSGVSICAGLIAFGGIGLLFNSIPSAGILAYLAAMSVQTVIRRLKRVKNEAMSREELYLCDGRIINTVLPGGKGTVEFNNIKGISATFVCKALNQEEKLRQDTEVRLVKFEGEVAVVERKDEFAEYSGSENE